MPIVKSLGTAGTAKRDKLAKKLVAEGKPKSNAYAIATAAEERNEGLRPPLPRKKKR